VIRSVREELGASTVQLVHASLAML
jgi:hypothetical protein